jgi:UDP-GlcNAc:undecaprenyl-phosphate GlcNAc-1-phosphate transferase
MRIFLTISTSFLIGFLFLPLFIKLLNKIKLGDKPGGHKIHDGLTPSLGGIVIYLAAIVTVTIWFDYDDLVSLRFLLTSFLIIFLLGIRDDIVSLNPGTKFLGQLIAALMVTSIVDIKVPSFNDSLVIYDVNYLFSYGFTIFLIILLTNSFNLLDGVDGLAGSIMFLVLIFMGWWFIGVGEKIYGILALVFASSLLSFLVFNWHPAKIFMGDTGSMTLGFIIAVFTVLFIDILGKTEEINNPFYFKSAFGSALCLNAIPILDTMRVSFNRIRFGKSPFKPDKNHVHHYLLRLGLGQKGTVTFLIFIQIVMISFIFLFKSLSDVILIPLISVFSFGLILVLEWVAKRKGVVLLSSNHNERDKDKEMKDKFIDKRIKKLNIFDN